MNGDNGLEFTEGPTKTRPGGLSAKPRQFNFSLKCFRPGKVALFREHECSILTLAKIQQTSRRRNLVQGTAHGRNYSQEEHHLWNQR